MKKLVLLAFFGGLIGLVVLAVPAHGQNPAPPPPVPGIPPPPPPPGGGATATPTLTPTSVPPTPTATPIPLFLTVKLAHKSVKVGSKQKVSVTTLPNASVHFTVAFPNKSKKTHSAAAGAAGTLSWSYKQASGKTTATNTTAKVTVSASNGTDTIKKSKKYKIS